MSSIGFYRIKLIADTDKEVILFVNGIPVSTKNVRAMSTCEGDLIIKYLDRNGHYRFFPFNKFYETSDNLEKIGSAEKFLVDILTDQSNQNNIGYRNNRIIQARADVTNEELDILKDLYPSPRVYLYIGTGTDLASDWLEVEITSFNPIIRRRKANYGRVDISIKLPKHYTVNML
jgi:hypothetical protein